MTLESLENRFLKRIRAARNKLNKRIKKILDKNNSKYKKLNIKENTKSYNSLFKFKSRQSLSKTQVYLLVIAQEDLVANILTKTVLSPLF